ncbi:MAG: hypothetical protein ACO2ON_01570 [Candidatus Nanopusillus sp.]
MTEENKLELRKDGVFEKVEEYILEEIEKVKSRKSLFEPFDINPFESTLTRTIKETFSKPYVVNDERQARTISKIRRVVSRLHKYVSDLQMLLESGRITDEATKEMAKSLITYYSSIISSLLMSYESIVSGVYNTGQNIQMNQLQSGVQNQKQQQ